MTTLISIVRTVPTFLIHRPVLLGAVLTAEAILIGAAIWHMRRSER